MIRKTNQIHQNSLLDDDVDGKVIQQKQHNKTNNNNHLYHSITLDPPVLGGSVAAGRCVVPLV